MASSALSCARKAPLILLGPALALGDGDPFWAACAGSHWLWAGFVVPAVGVPSSRRLIQSAGGKEEDERLHESATPPRDESH